MTYDVNNITDQDIIDALKDATDIGWLLPIEHGYCFSCHKEGMVYEIIQPSAPVQPPRCPTCFVDIASCLLDDPTIVARIQMENRNNESS